MATALIRKELLVNGFIKQIHKSFVIPLDIINLCCSFYSIPITIFYPSFGKHKQLFMANNKSTFSFRKATDFLRSDNHACFIPNISSYLNIKHHYNGIVLYYNTLNHAEIMLFKSNDIKQETVSYTAFHSTKTIPIPFTDNNFSKKRGCMQFCRDIASVILIRKNGFYSMDLHNIKIDNKYQSLMLTNETMPFFQLLSKFTFTTECIDTFGYINGHRKLFCMTDTGADLQSVRNYFFQKFILNPDVAFEPSIVKMKSTCNIFDLNTKQWIGIKPFSYEIYNNFAGCKFNVCKDNLYDMNNVYVASNCGHIGRFDVVKEDWTMVSNDLYHTALFKIAPYVFFNDSPFIIYGSDYHDGNHRYFDIRDCKKGWCCFDEMYEIMHVLQQQLKQQIMHPFFV